MFKIKYNVIDIAKHIVSNYQKRNDSYINTQILQKLLYYLKVKCLIDIEAPFLIEGTVQTSKSGPIFLEIYDIFEFEKESNIESRIDDKSKDYIDEFVIQMRGYDWFDLYKMSREEKIWKDFQSKINEGVSNLKYSDEEIKAYFTKNNAFLPWK